VSESSGPPTPRAPLPVLAGLDLRALLVEVTERVESVSLLADRLQALLQAVVSIGSQLDLPEVLHRIVETAAELGNAQYAALGVLDPSGESRLSQFITVGIDDKVRAEIGDLPHGRGVLGVLITEPRAIRLTNLADHPASYGFPPGHPPMHTFLGVPISVRGEGFGNLYLTEKQGGEEFTEADEQVVLALASAAGLAIQNARLYEEGQRRQEWLEAASAIQTRLLGGATAVDVFPDLVAAARQLADADLAFLALPVGDGTLRVDCADGAAADALHDGGIVKACRRLSPMHVRTHASGRASYRRWGLALPSMCHWAPPARRSAPCWLRASVTRRPSAPRLCGWWRASPCRPRSR
jgi:GAF domain-containing protein